MLKLVVIGVDGASWNILEKIKGLEVLSKKSLEKTSAWAILESTSPPWSIPAWNSLFSGLTPKSMKLYSFLKLEDNTFKPITYKLDDIVYVWDILSVYDKKTLAVNIPCIYTAKPVKGAIIAGFIANRLNLAYPKWVNKVLETTGYIVDIIDSKPITDEEYFEVNVKSAEKRTALFLELARKLKQIDLGIIVFTETDRMQHRFLKTRWSIIEKYYEVLDKLVAKIIDNLDDEAYKIIVSDHGFQKPVKAFNVNQYLALNNLLAVEGVNIRYRVKLLVDHLVSNNYIPLTIARKIAYKIGLARRLRKHGLEDHENNKTRILGAYMPSEEGGVFIVGVNEAYKKLVSEKALRKLNNVNGVLAYSIEDDSLGPSILIESETYSFSNKIGLPLWHKTIRATHSKYGVFAILGRHVENRHLGKVKITDITPTILYALNLPIPSYMEGQVIIKAFTRQVKPKKMDISYAKMKIKVNLTRKKIKENIEE